MSDRFEQTFLDTLLSQADIVEIVSKHVKLKKSGYDYSGLCPFHNEKTPSFTVSPNKKFYYCFGCGEHGNAIKFLMQREHLDFRSAVKYLAQKTGIQCPTSADESEQYRLNTATQHLMKKVQAYYTHTLSKDTETQAYLKARGLTPDIIECYGLGRAPTRHLPLQQLLKLTGDQTELLKRAGMLYEDKYGKWNIRFKGRLMFPIRNAQGHTIGFGARNLSNTQGP